MARRNNKANQRRKTIKMNRYKSRREMNIGILIFAVVFIYLFVAIFVYATSKRISVYEVREGSIVKDYSYTGIILRKEMLVNAESDGYINYYQNEHSKLKAGSKVYAISSEEFENPEQMENENLTISSETYKNLNLRVQNFNENFNPEKFSTVYSMKNEYMNTLNNATNQSRNHQLDSILSQEGISADTYTCVRDGVMVLTYDKYENLKESQLTSEDFKRGNYEEIHLYDQRAVKTGDPAYKLITDEKWDVYVMLDKNTAELLKDTSVIKVRIDKDSETLWADFSILKKGKECFGKLSFNDSMIRYCEDRFLNVELILEDQSGLKIPKSSVIEKDFYIVPTEYLTTSGSSYSEGVMVKSRKEVKYVPAEVYYTSDDGYAYLSLKDFKPHTQLVKPESGDIYTLQEKRPLKGVYNINQGYAVFKQVDILCENDDYYIVQEGTSYGLSNYDHIVQDGTSVREEEVVFQ